MSTRRDRIANEKVVMHQLAEVKTSGTSNSAIVDTQAQRTVAKSGTIHGHELLTNCLLIIGLGGSITAADTLQVILQDSLTNAAAGMAARGTLATITYATETLYIAQVNGFKRFVRIQMVAVAAVSMEVTIFGVYARDKRAPVQQVGTELAVTHAAV